MSPLPAGREASSSVGTPRYVRHRPEYTLLYQLVEEYYPAFKVHLAAQDRGLLEYVGREFDDYLGCGRLEQGLIPGILPSVLRASLRLFKEVKGPISAELARLTQTLAQRVGRYLERRRALSRTPARLDLEGDPGFPVTN